jgi:uncharacterized protein YjcR
MGVSKKLEQDFAKILYVQEKLSQKEIAERCKVTEKTVSKWVQELGWDKLRQSLLITKPHNLQLMYVTLTAMNEDMQGKIPKPAEIDALNKMTSSIKDLETEMGIGEMFNVGNAFINFVRNIDLNKAKEVYSLFDAFMQTKR